MRYDYRNVSVVFKEDNELKNILDSIKYSLLKGTYRVYFFKDNYIGVNIIIKYVKIKKGL